MMRSATPFVNLRVALGWHRVAASALLTPESFRRVVGRPQILLCTSVRDG